jgi:hypothetical protein
MKYFLLTLIFFIPLFRTSNGQGRDTHNKVAIMSCDSNQEWIFKDCKSTDLTNSEFEQIEIILKNAILIYNQEQSKLFESLKNKYPKANFEKKSFFIDLNQYYRQYLPVMNENGEKEIWINCFCNAMEIDWRENLIFVLDGGNCYFNLKINLSKQTYYDLIVNGDA